MQVNVYEQVTSRIIDQLTQGVVPWKSPYLATVGFPENFATGKRYRGMNVFLLGSLRYTSPYFLTFLQAKELGGHVRKGERGSLVIKYGTYTTENGAEDAPEGERRYLKAYMVFNSSQIDGIEFPQVEPPLTFTASEQCAQARAIVAGMPQRPEVKEGAAIPCYRPYSDSIHMPSLAYFETEIGYHSTLFHELAHSTGHQSRLARKSLLNNRGIEAAGEAKKVYAEEELVAEMAAAFLNAHAGIIEAEIENSAAYLAGWIKALQASDARSWIIKAAAEAQKAADYILGLQE